MQSKLAISFRIYQICCLKPRRNNGEPSYRARGERNGFLQLGATGPPSFTPHSGPHSAATVFCCWHKGGNQFILLHSDLDAVKRLMLAFWSTVH